MRQYCESPSCARTCTLRAHARGFTCYNVNVACIRSRAALAVTLKLVSRTGEAVSTCFQWGGVGSGWVNGRGLRLHPRPLFGERSDRPRALAVLVRTRHNTRDTSLSAGGRRCIAAPLTESPPCLHKVPLAGPVHINRRPETPRRSLCCDAVGWQQSQRLR